MAISGDADADVSNYLEYRSKKDEAWYTSAVVLEDGKQLRVKFRDFVHSYYDEVFSVADFSTKSELQEFLHRFRRLSEPIEDNECSRVIADMMVCATYKGDGSVRFFDAIVDSRAMTMRKAPWSGWGTNTFTSTAKCSTGWKKTVVSPSASDGAFLVHYKEHTPEKCLCTYLLVWQHGPEEGNITATSIEDICLIMPGAVDPKVTDFAKIVKEKLGLVYKRPFLSRKTSSNETLDELQARRGGFYPPLSDHDRDLGGVKETGCHHYIILENLEKDLSPSSMMEFLHVQTSITPQAFLFPSLSAETYARGAVVVDSRPKLKRIYEFLSNPNHFIVSSSGRPWVIAEAVLRTGTFDTNLQSCQPLCCKGAKDVLYFGEIDGIKHNFQWRGPLDIT
ncbi:hypothetical protein Ccrd_010987 [Cynara cardunculus var. scolymus]|uniref:SAWADEE domain-containing protein n=1 Tax=Cynara cardunculus var. scolymus TaxID=59895 RepID=A0A103YK93_CYNCS|nr:hypothetical protein Ccrd_010987 [Cynara cardunculus var. scolymus]